MSTIATATRLLASLVLPLAPAFAQSLLSQAQVVLNEGDPVPGLPGHVVGIAFGTTPATGGLADAPVVDRSGNLLFRARISGPSQTNGDSRTDLVWLYGRTRDSLQVLLRSGDPDPTGSLGAGTVLYATVGTQFATGLGAGARISAEQEYLLLPVALSGPNVVSTGTAASGRNDSALLLGRPGSLQKLVQRGDPFPGGGGSLVDNALSAVETQAMVLSPSGVAAFPVTLVGGDVTGPGASNSFALLTGTPGNLSVIVRGGDAVVSSTSAHVVESFGSTCQTNSLDQVLYEATLSTSVGTPPACPRPTPA